MSGYLSSTYCATAAAQACGEAFHAVSFVLLNETLNCSLLPCDQSLGAERLEQAG